MTGRREWHPSTDWYPTRTSLADPSLVEQDAIAAGLLRHTLEEDEADWYPIANSSPEERYRSTTILQEEEEEEEEEEVDHPDWSSTSSANASHSGTNAVSKNRRHKPQPTNNDNQDIDDEDRNVPDETERDTGTPDKTTQDTRTTTRNHPTKSRDADRDRVVKEEQEEQQQEEDVREDDDQSLHLRSVALVAPDSETYELIRVNTSTKEKVQKWKRRQQERGSFVSGSSNSSTVDEYDSMDQPPQPDMQDSASHSSSKWTTTRKSREDYSCSHYTDAGTCSSQSWTNLQRMQRSSSLPLFRSVPQPQSGSSNSNKSHPNPFGGSSMTRRTSSNQSAPSRSRTGKSLGGPAKSKDRTLPLRKGRSLGGFLSKKTLR